MTTPPKSPTIVIISNCNVGATFIVSEILSRYSVAKIIRPRWEAQKPRPKKLSLRARLNARVNEIYREWVNQRMLVALSRLLAPQHHGVPEALIVDTTSQEVNSKTVESAIAATDPDLIITCGAPLLNPNIFSLAKIAAINVHFGIAPKYRGEHTIFWPLKLGDYEQIGVTIHGIAKKIDAGPVLARAYPEIVSSDTEATLLAKCHHLALPILLEIIERVSQGSSIQGSVLPLEKKSLFRYNDRTITGAIKAYCARLLGYNPPHLPERIERMY